MHRANMDEKSLKVLLSKKMRLGKSLEIFLKIFFSEKPKDNPSYEKALSYLNKQKEN